MLSLIIVFFTILNETLLNIVFTKLMKEFSISVTTVQVVDYWIYVGDGYCHSYSTFSEQRHVRDVIKHED